MVDLKEVQDKIESFETQISEDEKKKANIEGKREAILEKLKKEFGVTEKEDIKNLLEKKQKELDELSGEIEIKLGKLESDFDWEE